MDYGPFIDGLPIKKINSKLVVYQVYQRVNPTCFGCPRRTRRKTVAVQAAVEERGTAHFFHRSMKVGLLH
jgi:hypothetical protein